MAGIREGAKLRHKNEDAETSPSLKADCFVLRTLAIATYIRNPPYRATCSYWWCAKYLRIPLCKHSVFSNAWLYFHIKCLQNARKLFIIILETIKGYFACPMTATGNLINKVYKLHRLSPIAVEDSYLTSYGGCR